jgi:hypothetical protein
MEWQILSGFFETPRVFVLSSKLGGFFAIPKRALEGTAEIDNFRQLLVRKRVPMNKPPR